QNQYQALLFVCFFADVWPFEHSSHVEHQVQVQPKLFSNKVFSCVKKYTCHANMKTGFSSLSLSPSLSFSLSLSLSLFLCPSPSLSLSFSVPPSLSLSLSLPLS